MFFQFIKDVATGRRRKPSLYLVDDQDQNENNRIEAIAQRLDQVHDYLLGKIENLDGEPEAVVLALPVTHELSQNDELTTRRLSA